MYSIWESYKMVLSIDSYAIEYTTAFWTIWKFYQRKELSIWAFPQICRISGFLVKK